MSEEKQPPRFSKAFGILSDFVGAEARGEGKEIKKNESDEIAKH